MTELKIAVLGAGGQLGQEFRCLSTHFSDWQFIFYSSNELNISDSNALKTQLGSGDFDYIINCAAYTAVDKAESEVEKCWLINAHACQYIAEVLKQKKTKLIHFSSDYVYHNDETSPLTEESDTHPQSVYARSKLRGEEILRISDIPTLIIRTSWVISAYGHNFVKTMMKLGREKQDIKVVSDQKGTPTYARDLAQTVLEIINKTEMGKVDGKHFNQTYNYSQSGETTWCDMAQFIMKHANLNCTVHPIPTSQYPTPAKRPLYSVLSSKKIQDTYQIQIRRWELALEDCLNEIIQMN